MRVSLFVCVLSFHPCGGMGGYVDFGEWAVSFPDRVLYFIWKELI